MLRNFIITSLRIPWRNKVVSAINILSLSIGITAFILILLYVHHETSYDKFNENYDRIYRLEGDEYARLPPLIGEYIADKIPEIEKVTKLQITATRKFNYIPADGTSGNAIPIPVLWADSTIFDVFTFPLVRGNPKHALDDPFEIVMTESFARKMFGDTDPIGKTLTYDNHYRSNNEFKVTGILKDIHQSHVKIDAIISRESAKISHPHALEGANQYTKEEWWTGTYLLLTKNANQDAVKYKINQVLQDINDESMLPIEFNQFYLRPIQDLYLKDAAASMVYGKHGSSNLIWSFLAIGLFVLLLAIFNYINLTTARSTLRKKEIIIKKVVGSSKLLLGKQFISESILLVFLSMLIALTTLQLTLPQFNQLAQIHINLSDFSTPYNWALLFAGILFIGIVSGAYPAIMLSNIKSVSSILSKSKDGIQGVRLRRILLTIQFSVSIVLIIGIITNLRQIYFVKNTDPGFNKDHVVLVPTPGGGQETYQHLASIRETFKDRLLQHTNIIKVGTGTTTLAGLRNSQIEINGEIRNIKRKSVDPDFLEVMDVRLLEGRNFSVDRLGDKTVGGENNTYRWLINETAAKEFWDESPVGKSFSIPTPSNKKVSIEIIGVVSDTHWMSMHHKVEPLVYIWTDWVRQLSIKVAPQNVSETIKIIEREWKNAYGSEPFVYSFLDEEFDAQYKSDERIATIIGYFTVIAIVIACMGLFGLSSFMAVRRTKEIGIRKTLGASSKTIFVMLSREYIKWILLSALIASPVAWYAMNKWLETFAYRIEMGPGVFVIAAIIALAIGLITVGWQALKSAVANPVKALRYE